MPPMVQAALSGVTARSTPSYPKEQFRILQPLAVGPRKEDQGAFSALAGICRDRLPRR